VSVRDLSIAYGRESRLALERVNLEVARGETLAVAGESGSGKSTLALALLGLLPRDARIISGEMHFENRRLDLADSTAWSDLRGARIGFVPQDTHAAFDPLIPIAEQLDELFRLQGASASQARARSLALLDEVGLGNAAELARELPERLSGGQRQR